MLKAERLQKILEKVSADNRVLLEELSQLLQVSTDTVRRDIKELGQKGLLKAVRGGAIINSVVHPHFRERQEIDVEEKITIAQKAVKFITSGMAVFINAGTTTASVVQELPKEIALTVFTNSFPVVSLLEDFANVETHFIGGQLNKRSFSTNGHETIESILNFRADLCLIGICSLDLQLGITESELQESLIKKPMIENSKYIIGLATFDKIGAGDPYFVYPANVLNALVTEKDPGLAELSGFRESGIRVV
jgi:DeoR/GlpR family transcriptional regulator of sugar metabolism